LKSPAQLSCQGQSARILRLRDFDSEFMRRDLVEASPLTWLLEDDGLLVDIRHAPAQFQVRAFELGLIPFVPGCR